MQQNNRFYNIKNGAIKCCTNCTFETGRSINPNCHSYCEKYLNEREELDKRNKEKCDKKEILWEICENICKICKNLLHLRSASN